MGITVPDRLQSRTGKDKVVFITHQTSLTLITQPLGTGDAPTTTNINRKVVNPHAEAMKTLNLETLIRNHKSLDRVARDGLVNHLEYVQS
jgi:hypothetical protein